MIVGVCRITLQLEDCHSEKDKRSVLRRIKDRVHQKWNCAIAEVGDGDSLDSAQLGIVVVSNQRGYTQSQVQKILQFIDDLAFARLTDDEQDFIDYGDGSVEDAGRAEYEHWSRASPRRRRRRRSCRRRSCLSLRTIRGTRRIRRRSHLRALRKIGKSRSRRSGPFIR